MHGNSVRCKQIQGKSYVCDQVGVLTVLIGHAFPEPEFALNVEGNGILRITKNYGNFYGTSVSQLLMLEMITKNGKDSSFFFQSFRQFL